ncbi:MAG TPA: SDR family NAD(P)-dependent oxidoreductase [Anaerolineae bacterium]
MPSLRDARVLVTGATGFIGAHLARRLLAEGAHVSAFRRVESSTARRYPLLDQAESIDWREVDLRTHSLVSKAVKAIRPDLVFHLASIGGTDPFLSADTAIRTNLYGTLHLLRAVDGKAPVIVTRTPGERDAMNVYTASKAAAWEFCRMYHRAYNWPIVGVMPFQTYGPGQLPKALVPSAITAALRGEDFPMTPGAQRRDWLYVDDVIEAYVRIGGLRLSAIRGNGNLQESYPALDGETIEVGSGQIVSVREVVDCIYRIAGGLGKPLVGALPARPGEVECQMADAQRTTTLIDWRAGVTLEDGLRETIEWTRAWQNQPTS